jgi:glutamyl-tRNA synthetase
MHVGNLRTALYEYLIAKSAGGRFILRIEDTDQERYVEGATDMIYQTLKAVGLRHDEGPDVGGPYGPYVQSQRRQIYLDAARTLVEKGWAYYCFCTKDRLEALHGGDAHAKYDRHCLGLDPAQARGRAEAGEPHVIRQRVPPGATTVADLVYGSITVQHDEIEDQVLIKTDGLPTYNFANVVDDHLMAITHVVRGSEYLSSAPKYNLLYEAFGWPTPQYVHLPLITNDQGEKLSKRKGHATFEDLAAQGFLPEALLNYIALLGWSPGGDREFFTLEELAGVFQISGLGKAPSVFDLKKLAWMNGEYLKKMEPERFYQYALPTLQGAVARPVDLRKVAAMVQSRIERLQEAPALLDFLDALPAYPTALYAHKKMKTTEAGALAVLKEARKRMEVWTDWTEAALHEGLLALAEEMGLKNGQVLWPVRTALSGKPATPCGATELLALLGQEESLARVDRGIELLAGA